MQVPKSDDTRGAVRFCLGVVPAQFVTIELAAAMTGFTPAAIRAKFAKGVWLEGRQWVKRDGRVLIDMREYERWAAGT